MKMYCAAALVMTTALAGCAGGGGIATSVASRTDWRTVATTADRGRLRGWRSAWVSALAQARADGHGGEIAADTALFDPDRMLSDPLPPPGDYRCRVIKLGSQGKPGLAYVEYPAFKCQVTQSGDRLAFDKVTGSQRPTGLIFPAEVARGVFLGTVVLGDESRAVDYGRDATRNMAGFVERIDTRRWRMVFPYPAFESILDVIELVPVR